jgi:hypothetical protein
VDGGVPRGPLTPAGKEGVGGVRGRGVRGSVGGGRSVLVQLWPRMAGEGEVRPA